MEPQEHRFLSKQDMARILKRSERTVDRRIESGQLPKPFKVNGGSAVFWEVTDLIKAIEPLQGRELMAFFAEDDDA